MIRRLWHRRFGHPGPLSFRGERVHCVRCGTSARYAHGRVWGEVWRWKLSEQPFSATEWNVWSP